MGFIDAYKRLEKLCGEILNDDRRVSAYIDQMLNTPRGSYLVRGWNEDLKQLKHYRWIRNQIVHDPACTEANMCCPEDLQWINGFYTRIMHQTDPLSLYRKAIKSRSPISQRKPVISERKPSKPPIRPAMQGYAKTKKQKTGKTKMETWRIAIALYIFAAIIAIVLMLATYL